MELSKLGKKGQLSLGDAPVIVLLVGLVFLVMATFAFIGEKYGNAIDTDNTAGTYVNESIVKPGTAGITLDADALKNGACGTITEVFNGTGGASIPLDNFTQTECTVVNATGPTVTDTFAASLLVNYPYTYSASTASSNVTDDLQTEIGNNTSIAGIILTISLVGIVLTILIGVFVGVRSGTKRV